MKAEFKLLYDTLEDKSEADAHMNGPRWKMIIWDLDQYLRQFVKYQEEEKWPNVEQVREHLRELIHEEGLNLND